MAPYIGKSSRCFWVFKVAQIANILVKIHFGPNFDDFAPIQIESKIKNSLICISEEYTIPNIASIVEANLWSSKIGYTQSFKTFLLHFTVYITLINCINTLNGFIMNWPWLTVTTFARSQISLHNWSNVGNSLFFWYINEFLIFDSIWIDAKSSK